MAEPGPWPDVSRRLEAHLGLHFEPRRWPELERGLATAAGRLGLPDATACARRIQSARPDDEVWPVLAECLAVGETYFFRDGPAFDDLAARVLEPLIATRRAGTRRLRLWSAGCSTGEEAWSLAMLVASRLPDWRKWDIDILATDINASALREARAGRYGRWSVRSGVPPWAGNWLHRGPDGEAEVDAELRALVHFDRLNLADEGYPSVASRTTSIDLLLCRNVLIYFEPDRARQVLARLGAALAPGGWLVTGAMELPREGVPGLAVVTAGSLTALRPTPADPPPVAAPAVAPPPAARAARGHPARPAAARPDRPASTAPAGLMLLARSHADAGELQLAEQLCREAVRQDKLNPEASHLLAAILHERGSVSEAMAALQRTLYLDPEHVLARFRLGSLALQHGQPQAGRRHLAQARAQLARCSGEDPLLGSGGLTAGELQACIRYAEARG